MDKRIMDKRMKTLAKMIEAMGLNEKNHSTVHQVRVGDRPRVILSVSCRQIFAGFFG